MNLTSGKANFNIIFVRYDIIILNPHQNNKCIAREKHKHLDTFDKKILLYCLCYVKSYK